MLAKFLSVLSCRIFSFSSGTVAGFCVFSLANGHIVVLFSARIITETTVTIASMKPFYSPRLCSGNCPVLILSFYLQWLQELSLKSLQTTHKKRRKLIKTSTLKKKNTMCQSFLFPAIFKCHHSIFRKFNFLIRETDWQKVSREGSHPLVCSPNMGWQMELGSHFMSSMVQMWQLTTWATIDLIIRCVFSRNWNHNRTSVETHALRGWSCGIASKATTSNASIPYGHSLMPCLLH